MWKPYQESIGRLTRNNLQYLGDYLTFGVIWIGAFTLGAHTQWAAINRPHFWPVMIFLLAMMWLSWMRVSRAIVAVPRMYLQFLSLIIQTDPDFQKMIETAG